MKRVLTWALSAVLGSAAAWAVLPVLAAAQDADKPAVRAHKSSRSSARNKSKKKANPEDAAQTGIERRSKQKRHAARDKVAARSQTQAVPSSTHPKAELGPNAAEAAAQAAASGVNAQIVKEGDTSVKVMEFTGLGIEGRLKSPQLVYFVQRVRAEFERPVLPHRSFMPELADSTGREQGR